jgi:hypothetical protein
MVIDVTIRSLVARAARRFMPRINNLAEPAFMCRRSHDARDLRSAVNGTRARGD